MAFEDLGRSFMPLGAARETAGPGGNRLEDVLRILSFRLPRILGSRPIAPEALLRADSNPLASSISSGVLANLFNGSPIPQGGPGAPSPLSSLMAPLASAPEGPSHYTPAGSVTEMPQSQPGPMPDLSLGNAPLPRMVPVEDEPTTTFDDVRRQLRGGAQRV